MLEIEGTRIFYSVAGDGIPIIFIHPPLLTSANFTYQMKELSKNYKVIIFDIRGHGRSEYSKQAITYSLIVDDIRNLLDHLRIEKAFICGYSTGGSIVCEFMLSHSDRALGGIIISGMSEASDVYLRKRISLAKNISNPKSLSILASAIAWGNADKKEIFKQMFSEAIKGDPRNIKQYYDYSLNYNCTNLLGKIYLPILLVYGTKDKSFHHYAQLLHERLPSNKLKFLEKERHQIPTKAANKLNQLISQFLIQEYKRLNY
ncbi:MAG: alpha/beta hydrolase [Neobacillus sp.]|jgi:pimeloyl-ACP methyl ester carboxylesterase|nr:alpha/beta hydrolase [Neobacillus sp.]